QIDARLGDEPARQEPRVGERLVHLGGRGVDAYAVPAAPVRLELKAAWIVHRFAVLWDRASARIIPDPGLRLSRAFSLAARGSRSGSGRGAARRRGCC